MARKSAVEKSEKQIQSEVLAYLKQLSRCKAYKVISANERGVADILLCYKGQFVAFETKRPRKDLEPIQAAQFKLINQAGGYAFRIRSKQDAIDAITLIDSERHGL